MMNDISQRHYYVEKDVLSLGVKIVFVELHGIDNHHFSREWFTKRDTMIKELLKNYDNVNFHEDPVFEGFHILHDRAGVKRRKNIPASENLVRQLRRIHDMPVINQLVDIYNLMSLSTKLALGAHDLDHVTGHITLRMTNGTEGYQPIGRQQEGINPHEYAYCDDDNDVLCRLEIRQVEKTKVDMSSENVFLIVQGNEATSQDYLIDTASKLINEITHYCGGEGIIIQPEIIN